MNNEFKKEVERLNIEVIDLYQSREYRLGKKVLLFVNLLRKLKFITIIKKIIESKKRSKLVQYQFTKDNEIDNQPLIIDSKFNKKLLVYTCITGNYDEPSTIYLKEKNVDYVLFTNNKRIKSDDWKVIYIDDKDENFKNLKNNEVNRFLKMHPAYVANKKYDYTIYVDGNISIVSTLTDLIDSINSEVGVAMHKHKSNCCVYDEARDCILLKKGNKEEIISTINKYKNEKMPEKFGLAECGVIVTDLNNENSKTIMDAWWKDLIDNKTERDQLTLPYSIFILKKKMSNVTTLGNNIYRNPKFRILSHKD